MYIKIVNEEATGQSNFPRYKVKQSKNSKFTSNYKAIAQSNWKRKFPSLDKPLRI